MTSILGGFANSLGSNLAPLTQGRGGDFFDLIKSIGESKSKQEEDRIILGELQYLKDKMMAQQPQFSKKMKEFLIRLIYCEMLGHDASFGYIRAVELCASTNLLQKRCGYLTASLCFSPENEFRFMLLAQMQRDLKSSNYLEVSSGLSATCKLITPDTIPAIINDVSQLLKHDHEAVRKRAVMCLHRFHQLDPTTVQDYDDKLRRVLCDRDPSVMAATLCIMHDMCKESPLKYKDLVPSFVSILKQITDHRLPRDFDYHRIPAPWIQIHLLRILAILGRADKKTSEGMYEVLVEAMRRADTGINAGYAIVYECVRTVTTIYPNTALLDAAANSIARFIGSDNHNLKYLGVKGLALIVTDHPRYAQQHQVAVIECLEDEDETLKRKTLDLLYRMTNGVNVSFITSKLLEYLEKAGDLYLRKDLVKRITNSAERYAPSNEWYIQTITRVFILAGELVKEDIAHSLMVLIAEGTGEDEEEDMNLRKSAVENYFNLLDNPDELPDLLIQVLSWVLGEYAYLCVDEGLDMEDLILTLAGMCKTMNFKNANTRGYLLSSIMKLSTQTGTCPSEVTDLLDLYSNSIHLDLQQKCYEYLTLLKHPHVCANIFPVDASCEDLEVDENLQFLDNLIEQEVRNGKPRYSPPQEVIDNPDDVFISQKNNKGLGLNFDAYAMPEKPKAGTQGVLSGTTLSTNPDQNGNTNTGGQNTTSGSTNSGTTGLSSTTGKLGLATGGSQKWSRTTLQQKPTAPSSSGLNSGGIGGLTTSVPESVLNPSNNSSTSLNEKQTSNEPPSIVPIPNSNEPRELSEQEKKAAALFGGLSLDPTPNTGGNSNSSLYTNSNQSQSRFARKSTANSYGNRRQTPQRQQGGTNASTSTPPRRNPPAPVQREQQGPSNSGSVDLLDSDFFDAPSSSVSSNPSPPPQQSQAPSMNTMSSNNSLDLLSDLGVGSPVQQSGSTSERKEIPTPTAKDDPFGNFDLLSSSGSGLNGGNDNPTMMGNMDSFLGMGSMNSAPAPLSPNSMNALSIRPFPLKTSDFGPKWIGMNQVSWQKKVSINGSMKIRSVEHMSNIFASQTVALHVVEVIQRTNEAIASGTVNTPDQGAVLVLVHGTMNPNSGYIEYVVKSTDDRVRDRVSAILSESSR